MNTHHGMTMPILLLAFVLVALGAAPARGAGPPPMGPGLAVLDFQAVGTGREEATAVADQLRSHLVRSGTFAVLERSRTDAVLAELAFQQVGFTSPDQAAKLGRQLNVEFILTGSLSRLPEAYQVEARMIRVETARVERSESLVYRGTIVGLLGGGLPGLATRLSRVPAPAGGDVQPPRGAVLMAQQRKPTWPLWAGGVALLGALAVERDALSKQESAQAKAETARARNDQRLFRQAELLHQEAATGQQRATALSAVGLGLVLYYLFSDPVIETVEVDGDRAPAPPPFDVRVTPGKVAAGYTRRW